MTQILPNLSDRISSAVGEAAQRVADQKMLPVDEVHRRGVCRVMTAEILSILIENDISAYTDSRRPFKVDEHRYPVIEAECPDGGTVNEIVVDAAWWQFLPEGTDTKELPRALIGTRDEVVAQAAVAGVPPEDLRIWFPADQYTAEPYLTPQEIVARAIDARNGANESIL